MPQQSDYPDKWACESAKKTVRIEVSVPNDSGGYDWIEIPTTSVEQWIQKGEASQLQRSVKVQYPSQWGDNTATVKHNEPRRLITEIDADNRPFPFQLCRVYWKDQYDNWVLTHFGWVGGKGATDQAAVQKFWVYDFGELLSGVPIRETFATPTVKQLFEQITKLTADNTPIPITDAVLIPPNAEEERIVKERSDLGPTIKKAYESADEVAGAFTQMFTLGAAGSSAQTTESGNYTARIVDTVDLAIGGAKKSFTANHDTLLDVFEWYEKKTGSKLTFEPQENGVALVSDVQKSRRSFVQEAYIRRELNEGNPVLYHMPITVLDNDALYEIKPKNTLHLRGSTQKSFLGIGEVGPVNLGGALDSVADQIEGGISSFLGGEPPAEKYPVVKLRNEALYEAANKVELSPPVIESDATTVEKAKKEAFEEFDKVLEEQSEGEMVLHGTPRLLPFDRVRAFETCGDYIQFEPEIVDYEVESVKHTKRADGIYKTRIKVSIYINESNTDVLKATMVEIETNQGQA